MNNPVLPHSLDPDAIVALRTRGEKGLRKTFHRFKPRNPLNNTDSNERIQGNPILISGAFAANRPRAKKTQIDRMSVRPAVGKSAEPGPPKGKAL